jgi:hypothetical protein
MGIFGGWAPRPDMRKRGAYTAGNKSVADFGPFLRYYAKEARYDAYAKS